MMTWKSNEQPHWVWDQDIWERGKDGKFFIAFTNREIWLGKDNEIIPFASYIIIGK